MIITKGLRVCPACTKAGKLLPIRKNGGNVIFRRYHCQSCHWTGTMFRLAKKQSRPAFYFTLVLFLGAAGGVVLVFLRLLNYLPDEAFSG